ncbi:hypothetical protein ELH70_15370 [Rhizobium ruizarguesonis]|uniref:hypothetical protein n=1 Tax=Rhizobium ruizarguesonis TaxID=2081791 RepID=UPI00103176C4|nr:hypothetical protein [Rhizobium ruizarguesonis]TAZ73931.1 hypothetical protein ELH70_15370 [Rhizobium ruizarguesonis]TBA00533.1 hypothetical protein ELH69_14550 [Rhizobium ruizarguesonis]
MSNELPDHLALNGKQRTTNALSAIENQKIALINELHSGVLLKALDADKSYLNLSRFCTRAGLSENFLNGKLHKVSLKPAIKKFLKDLKRDAQQTAEQSGSHEKSESDIDRLTKILKRATDQLHAETLRANEAEKQLKEILAATRPKIVEFPR